MKIATQEISLPLLKEKGIRLFIKRIDQIHKYVSGNKWFKLKYNLIEAKRKEVDLILTFGGAYSNHISATAFLANEHGFNSVGIIRGEKCFPLNHTLSFALEKGMKIHYLNRSDYRLKHTDEYLKDLRAKFGDFYLIPEGGANNFAIQGAEEILELNDNQDYICCPVGTGVTISGIINSKNKNQHVIGFSAIKGFNLLEKKIEDWVDKNNWMLLDDYSLGGYAKLNNELVQFINYFFETQNIPLDIVYNGKMMFGIMDLVATDYFPKGSSILAIHTGGIQGNVGMNERFGFKLPIE